MIKEVDHTDYVDDGSENSYVTILRAFNISYKFGLAFRTAKNMSFVIVKSLLLWEQ